MPMILMGHGEINVATTNPEVLIPPGTSVKYFQDVGQALSVDGYIAGDKSIQPDFTRLSNVWETLGSGFEPLKEYQVTYNMTLFPFPAEVLERISNLNWGSATPAFIESGELTMCTGTADTCPTPALLVTAQTEEVPDEKWKHTCDGILAQAEGQEIWWIACTVVEGLDPSLAADFLVPDQDVAPDEDPEAFEDTKRADF